MLPHKSRLPTYIPSTCSKAHDDVVRSDWLSHVYIPTLASRICTFAPGRGDVYRLFLCCAHTVHEPVHLPTLFTFTPHPCITKNIHRSLSGRRTWNMTNHIAVCDNQEIREPRSKLYVAHGGYALSSIYVKNPRAPPRAPRLTNRNASTHNFMSRGGGRASLSSKSVSRMRV